MQMMCSLSRNSCANDVFIIEEQLCKCVRVKNFRPKKREGGGGGVNEPPNQSKG